MVHKEVKKEEIAKEDYADLMGDGQIIKENNRFKENQTEN